MSATTVLAPTPALPAVRRASVWEKMLGNFKIGKPEDEDEDEDSMNLPLTSPIYQDRAALASTSTGVEQTNAYKRNASVAMTKDARTCSAPVPTSEITSPKTRPASVSTRRSSRSGRRSSWWRSANPETDSDVPAVPAIDRKFSTVFGSHNPDEPESMSPAPSPSATRRPSYVPRNAASSFLRTTTPLSPDEKAEVIRRASVADVLATKAPRPISHRPAPLNLKHSNDNMAQYNMYTAPLPRTDGNGLLTPAMHTPGLSPGLVSPRGGTFSIASGPRTPADTIMEIEVDESQIDSAKPSPSLFPVKTTANVSVVELVA